MDKLTIAITKELGLNHLNRINDGFQNIVYSLNKDGQEVILRASKCKDIHVLRAELDWLTILDANNISVAKPVSSRIEEVHVEGEIFYITLFEKIKGAPVNVSQPSEWNNSFFKEWGRTIGKLHVTAKQSSAKFLQRPRWTKEKPDLLLNMNELSPILQKKYCEQLHKLKAFQIHNDNFGLIHNDLHQGNFFVNEKKVTIFDFDDCAYHWFSYDIAVSFYHAFWQGISFNPNHKNFGEELMLYLLEGYSEENMVHADILKQIPIHLKIRELFLYQLFMEKWDLSNLQGWQQYTLEDMRKRIENDIPYSNLDFVNILK